MRANFYLALSLVCFASLLRGQDAFPPGCIAPDATSNFTAEYDSRVFVLTSEACRTEFLTDPERYSQLYDALRDLTSKGKKTPPPRSLVPS